MELMHALKIAFSGETGVVGNYSVKNQFETISIYDRGGRIAYMKKGRNRLRIPWYSTRSKLESRGLDLDGMYLYHKKFIKGYRLWT